MPAEIALRHRPTQFGHIFSGDHYASGYYSYMWSEVMDADAFGAFEEAGDIFDPATAKRLHDDIYSSGGSRDPEDAYVAFRGREPEARRAAAPPGPARNAGGGVISRHSLHESSLRTQGPIRRGTLFGWQTPFLATNDTGLWVPAFAGTTCCVCCSDCWA